jgi:hypothetical protein
MVESIYESMLKPSLAIIEHLNTTEAPPKKIGNSIANISFIIFAAGIYCNKQSNHEVDQQLTINNQQSNHQLNQQPTFSPAALPPPGTAQAPGLRVFGGGSLQAQCRRRVPGGGADGAEGADGAWGLIVGRDVLPRRALPSQWWSRSDVGGSGTAM